MSAEATDRPIRIAVAGLGKMGVMHAAMIKAIPGAELAALVDADANIGKQVRSMGADAPWFADIAMGLKQTRPDGVIIGTPQFTHRALAETCLEAGVAVMSEKPLAHTLADARAMADAARRRPDVPAGVGYMLAHHPLFERAARIVAEGALGEVKAARARCCLSQVFSPKKGWTFTKEKAGGGVLINSGVHLLFVLMRILGPVRGVFARGAAVHNRVEDTFSALADFQSGVFASIDVTWSVPGYEYQTHDVWIEGTRGALEVGNEVMRLWLIDAAGEYAKGWTQWRRDETEPLAPFTLSPDYCGDEFYLEDEDFVHAIREKRQPRVGFEEALRVQEFLAALYASMESGNYIRVDRIAESATR